MKKSCRHLPEQFLQELSKLYRDREYNSIISAFHSQRPLTIRVNTLNISIDGFDEILIKSGVNFTKVKWLPEAYIIPDLSLSQFLDIKIDPCTYYIQNLSSMASALILAPCQGEKILDIAAAPGSKTTQLVSYMNNKGEIVANDKSPVRIKKLEYNLNLQKVKIARITKYAGQIIWKQFPEYFDKTLCDVPCSGEGTFLCSNSRTFKYWSQDNKDLIEVQKWLLRSAISATKPGGLIIYSTCTLNKRENEEVINWILKKEDGIIKLEDIKINELELSPGIQSNMDLEQNKSLYMTKRIFPNTVMEGFYLAKIRKIKSNM